MPVASALLRSSRSDWETPKDLFALLNREFAFTLDVCATRSTRKCSRFFSAQDNGLGRHWTGSCWMNPPYGRSIALWLQKACAESCLGACVVCLIPARTDTAWWQDYVMRAREIRLLRGRITFVGAASPAPFPSAVAIFGRGRTPFAAPRVIAWDWRKALRAAAAA